MTPERWRKIESLLQAALERTPAERGAFLDEACGADDALRKEVESLLVSSDAAEDFLKSPVIEDAATLLGESNSASTIRPDIGHNIGPYSILYKLGAGGMGEVYLARDSRLGRNVALKLLHPDLVDSSQERMRFLREARLASGLDHPNICTIHEVGEASGRLFIAMQFVEGQTLKEVIGRRPLSLPSLLSISLQVADALSAAHSQGIVHRDIKPGNIMITGRGQAKVLDFGLAKVFERSDGDADRELTRTGVLLGTPSYMSPEQARGERTDHRSDIFSMGVVLYEMSTGCVPFKGRSHAETLNAVINQPHQHVTELNQEVPPQLAAVIDRALAKDRTSRYQSIHELVEGLRQSAESLGLGRIGESQGFAMPYIPLQESAAVTRLERLPQTKIVGASVLVILAMALVLFWWHPWARKAAPQLHQHLISTFPGSHRSASFSPDATRFAFVNAASDGVQQVWVKDLSQGDPSPDHFWSRSHLPTSLVSWW